MANSKPIRKPSPSDVSEEEWAFVAPYGQPLVAPPRAAGRRARKWSAHALRRRTS